MTEILDCEVRVIPEVRKLRVRCFDCHMHFGIEPGQIRWLAERARKTPDGAIAARVFVTDRSFLAVDIPYMALAFKLTMYTARTLREKQAVADEIRRTGDIEVAL